MKVLKGFGLGFLGFLLYVAVSVFGLAFTLNSTVLNPNFVATEVGKLDVSSLARDVAKDQISSRFGSQVATLVTPIVDSSLNELKPWINEQVRTAVFSSYDYLLGKSQDFKITIQLDAAKQVIIKNINQNPPPELQQLPQANRDQVLKQIEQQINTMVPSTYTVDRSTIGTEGMKTLSQARQAIGYFQTAYIILIVVMVVFIIGIVLIHRQVRGATRQLGVISLVCGAIDYAGFFFAKTFVAGQISAQSGLPGAVQSWLPQFIADFLSPMQIYSIVLLVVGVILLVVSFVYKPAAAE